MTVYEMTGEPPSTYDGFQVTYTEPSAAKSPTRVGASGTESAANVRPSSPR
ncbi:hypothetical protein JBE04_29010 [Streptomyces sp. PRKS01-29]|nr:hypothetical protein [Streptomyces sabulosicollis]MBI0298397.1 hypothetical protein [Streptomyces sabulosicollis]